MFDLVTVYLFVVNFNFAIFSNFLLDSSSLILKKKTLLNKQRHCIYRVVIKKNLGIFECRIDCDNVCFGKTA